MFEFSKDAKHGYPFMLASFTLTKTTMDMVREGVSVEEAHELYGAMMSRMGERWRNEGMTLVKFQKTIEEIKEEVKQMGFKLFLKKYYDLI